ncbi:MAG TPA: universal stress protein [Xanthobacteraceae bacterium]|nr:universal stress protein [Xanthobacteraceae bacterium]
MPRRRQSLEPGHRRKFLVVVDQSAECDRAVYFAARRAARTEGGLVLLGVIDLEDAGSQWLGVAELMRAEAADAAQARLDHYTARARSVAGVEAEGVLRAGGLAGEVAGLIEHDPDIAVLVLANGAGDEGPGPLLAALAGGLWLRLPVPITIVPGTLSDAELEALS